MTAKEKRVTWLSLKDHHPCGRAPRLSGVCRRCLSLWYCGWRGWCGEAGSVGMDREDSNVLGSCV